MRHRKRKTRLSRTQSERKALLSNLVTSLFNSQTIHTTLPKAKEAKRLTEKLITKAKTDSVHSRRMVARVIKDRNTLSILFNKIAPLFKDRNGGYTRVYQLGNRHGDGAKMAVLELVDKYIADSKVKVKKVKEKKDVKVKSDHDVHVEKPKPEKIKKKPEVIKKDVKIKKKKEEEKKTWIKSFKKIFGKDKEKNKE